MPTTSAMDLLQPGQPIKPPFEVSSVAAFIEKRYGMKVLKVKEMNSYDDRNFYVIVDKSGRQDTQGNEFTLKVTNALDSKAPGLLETMNELLVYLDKNGLSVPVPMATKNAGGLLVTLLREKLDPTMDDEYAFRLMTFIPGKLLYDVPYEPDILTKIGAALAKLDVVLETYRSELLESRVTIWSLLSIPQVKEFTEAVDDLDRRQLVNTTFDEFATKVLSKLDKLPSALIHADFNEQNILVKENSNGGFDVSGILDFGDVHKAPQVFDLAILCAYAMLECTVIDPLSAPGHVIAGYQKIRQLSADEWSVVPIAIASRLGQSLTLGAYSYKNDPGNEYLLTTAKTGWKILKDLRRYSDQQLIDMWKRQL